MQDTPFFWWLPKPYRRPVPSPATRNTTPRPCLPFQPCFIYSLSSLEYSSNLFISKVGLSVSCFHILFMLFPLPQMLFPHIYSWPLLFVLWVPDQTNTSFHIPPLTLPHLPVLMPAPEFPSRSALYHLCINCWFPHHHRWTVSSLKACAFPCCAQPLSCAQLSATPWTDEAPLSMGFSRQEYWSRLPFPPPADLSDPRIQPASLESPAMTGRCFTTAPPRKPLRRQRPPLTHLCPPDLAQCLHTVAVK